MSDLQKRVQTWSSFAEALHKSENEISILQNKVIETLKGLEITTENIKLSEEVFDIAKNEIKQIKEIRKSKTDPLDKLKAKLMEYEKQAAEVLKEKETDLIQAKKILQKEREEVQAKEDEKNAFIQHIKTLFAQYFSRCEQIVHQHANDVYYEMLEKELDWQQYDQKVEKSTNFTIPTIAEFGKNNKFIPQVLTKSEMGLIYTDNKQPLPDFNEMFKKIMTEKKSGYKSELANKEEAKKRMQEEQKKAEEDRKKRLEMEQLEIKMDADSKPEIQEDFKKLKQTFELDMEETPENAIKLFASFSANYQLCLSELRVKNWFNLSPKQIGQALAKAKSKDNSLKFQGINFKSVDKL